MPEIGSKRLPSLLVHLLKSLVPFDNAVILHYRHDEQPLLLYNDIPPAETKAADRSPSSMARSCSTPFTARR